MPVSVCPRCVCVCQQCIQLPCQLHQLLQVRGSCCQADRAANEVCSSDGITVAIQTTAEYVKTATAAAAIARLPDCQGCTHACSALKHATEDVSNDMGLHLLLQTVKHSI